MRKGRDPTARLIADLRTEIPGPDRLLLIAGLAATVWYALGGPQWAGAVGVGIPGSIWAVRYFGGVPRPQAPTPARPEIRAPRGRQNLHGVTAAVLFGLAAISLSISGATQASAPSSLSSTNTAGWIALSLIAAMLVGFQNHEKRLLGSYGTQRTWLRRNLDGLIEKGYFERTSPDDNSTR
jgi:hypothetical protein